MSFFDKILIILGIIAGVAAILALEFASDWLFALIGKRDVSIKKQQHANWIDSNLSRLGKLTFPGLLVWPSALYLIFSAAYAQSIYSIHMKGFLLV